MVKEAALYGIYAEGGVIDVNAILEKLGIDDSPNPLTKQEKQVRIVDILCARSGVCDAVDASRKRQRRLKDLSELVRQASAGGHCPSSRCMQVVRMSKKPFRDPISSVRT